MRIITRPDFDGIVCAALLYEALNIRGPVEWVEPNAMEKGMVELQEGDVIANLPYNEKCSLWFDHHFSNRIDKPFNGVFKIAPSAAGIVFGYYKDKFKRDYSELIREADKIDSANLSLDEVLYPEKYAYVLLSMTILSKNKSDEPYWNKLVYLLRNYGINKVFEDSEVKERCEMTIEQNKRYKTLLKENTSLKEQVSITDFRSFDKMPYGNRFLVYSLFPESVVNVKIQYESEDRNKVALHIGHSIFNRNCNVNVGLMLAKFGGGGHRGAGAGRFHVSEAEKNIGIIIDILLKNEMNEP